MSDNPKPLILLTRPHAASERFGATLTAEVGSMVEVVIAPLMEIVPLNTVPDLTAAAGVIFTSEVAVQQVKGALSIPAWCVGDRTAEAADRAGYQARSAQGTADDLVAMILAERPLGRLVHLHGRHTRGDVVGRLRNAGLAADGYPIYDQIDAAVPQAFTSALTHGGPVFAPLFSPRSATLFAAAAGPRAGRTVTLLALSDSVKAELPEDWKHACHLAPTPTGPAIVYALRNIISR